MNLGGNHPEWQAEGAAGCRQAGELLQASQYEQVAALLHIAQTKSAQAGDVVLSHLLDAARLLCVSLIACHAEVERHRQACQETERREQKLRQELHSLLDLLGNGERSHALPAPEQLPLIPAPPASDRRSHIPPPPTEPAERRGLWQRIRGLLPGRSSEKQTEILVGLSRRPKLATPALTQDEEDQKGEQAPPSLVVYCLGPFRVYQDDQPVEEWPSSKGKSILKYLVTHRERPIAKEILMDLFWPNMHPDAARNNLNVAIYGLRQALRKARPSFSHVLFQDDCYLLAPELWIWVDSENFMERLSAAQALERRGDLAAAVRECRAAEALYQGEFLEEDRYEDWLIPQRQSLQDGYLCLLDRLSRYYFDQEDYAACATMCGKILAVDACREETHRQLMRCYSRQGQPYLAVRQYHLCVETLREELEVPPMERTLALYQRIHEGEAV